jgi:hypothetical protein
MKELNYIPNYPERELQSFRASSRKNRADSLLNRLKKIFFGKKCFHKKKGKAPLPSVATTHKAQTFDAGACVQALRPRAPCAHLQQNREEPERRRTSEGDGLTSMKALY